MYAEVVVPTYKGPNVDFFTYEIPKGLNVKVGQLVFVPFGKVRVIGVVINNQSQITNNKYPIKPIQSMLFEKPFLLPYQLKLLRWMAEYYLSTMGNCANAMLPELPKTISKVDSCGFFGQESTLCQTLILVPTINRLPQVMALFPKAKNHVVYHGQLKPAEKLSAWEKILVGDADYIFGSRQAIFSPCRNLKRIIIFSEHEGAYKDERSPFFDTLTVAQKISSLTGCKLDIIDSSPKITTFHLLRSSSDSGRAPADAYALAGRSLARMTIPKPKNQTKVKIVSLADEKLTGNKSPISGFLEISMEQTVKSGGQVLLFLNKKKESGTMYCRSCKHQTAYKKKPDNCPNCGSGEIWFGSLNINSLEKEVVKLFPKTRVEKLTDRSYLFGSAAQITIATSAVFYKLMLHKYDLVAAVSLDSLINTPEFTSGEKLFSLVTMLKRVARNRLVLQTNDPENLTISDAAASNYLNFFSRELLERKQLSYPPFGVLIKLVFKGKDSEKTLTKAEKLCNLLTSSFGQAQNPPSILGPFEPFYQKRMATFHVILKMKLESDTLKSRENAVSRIAPLLLDSRSLKLVDQIIVDPEGVN